MKSEFVRCTLLAIFGLALLASPALAQQSDDEAGRLVVGAPGAGRVQVEGTGSLTTLFARNNSFSTSSRAPRPRSGTIHVVLVVSTFRNCWTTGSMC